jgi:hypothetical protein
MIFVGSVLTTAVVTFVLRRCHMFINIIFIVVVIFVIMLSVSSLVS